MSILQRFGLIAALLATSGGYALAGDIASFQPIGFSSDASLFAFEEFGIQDGSGFPYSSIFFIDIAKDRFAAGTPFRVRLDDEKAGLGRARSQTAKKAAALIEKYEMADNPGFVAAFNPVTEIDSPPHEIRYREYATDTPIGGAFALKLEEVPLPAPAGCKDFAQDTKGFRLTLTEAGGQARNQPVHLDDVIPESRNCPLAYRLAGVVVAHPQAGASVHVALVQVFSFGFEGRDGRWIAVPVGMAP